MARHIFIDNSNVFNLLKTLKETLEPDVSGKAIRLHLDHFFDLVENGDAVATKVFGGSEKRTAEAVWDKARDRGYDTYILQRVSTGHGETAEQAVDEVMHLLIANAILDFDALQTLVIVSGDGKDSDFGTSFVAQAERALRHGWHVEVWSWAAGMTGRYDDLCARYPGRIRKRPLDPHYYSISFVVYGEGRYDHYDGRPASDRTRIAEPVDVDAAGTPRPFAARPPVDLLPDGDPMSERAEQPWV